LTLFDKTIVTFAFTIFNCVVWQSQAGAVFQQATLGSGLAEVAKYGTYKEFAFFDKVSCFKCRFL